MLFFLEHFDQAVAFSHQALMVGKAALWNLCDESTFLYGQHLSALSALISTRSAL
jgi:hypothetical protein